MLSVIILTCNEEKNIARALQSVSFADELIVVDDGSTDRTKEIAVQNHAQVIPHPLSDDFSSARNFGTMHAKGDWVLQIDADEELTKNLADEIKKITESANADDVYFLRRRDFFWGRDLTYGETSKVRNKGLIRLFKKNTGEFKGKVHEEFVSTGKAGRLNGFINHYPHPTIKEFLNDINHYSTVRAHALKNQGVKPNVFVIIFFPFFKFLTTYFIFLGFLDGAPGFVYAFMMSFHSFLVRSKLYQYSEIDT